jgi:hypothetical protein
VPGPGSGARVRGQVPRRVPRPGLCGNGYLIAEGDYVVGQWKAGGTQTGEALDDILVGALPPGGGKKMELTGMTVVKVENGLITEEVGIDGVTALQQLGLIPQQ